MMQSSWANYPRYEIERVFLWDPWTTGSTETVGKARNRGRKSSPEGVEVDEGVNGRRKERVPRRGRSPGAFVCALLYTYILLRYS